jgi:uncharacterized protein (DUF2235 family)
MGTEEVDAMAKNIVFCADGTWNGPGKDLDDEPVAARPSNVLKLYRWLAGRDQDAPPTAQYASAVQYAGEAERVETDAAGNQLQVAKYLDGVGYDDNPLVKALGGAFGAGLIARIVRGYTYISRNYLAGDRIFVVGFSRGAYTARALAGLIVDQGLLDATKLDLSDKDAAYKLGCAVWHQHQQVVASKGKADLLDRLQQALFDVPGLFSSPPDASKRVGDVRIQAVAVWDTVGAMGIPKYDTEDRRVDAFRFADLDLSPRVLNGFHALSLDEQRVDFTPTLWNPRDNLVQRLFPGAHADVGGSYPTDGSESALSDGALVWMQQQLASLPGGNAVHFGDPPEGVSPDAGGVAHQPWTYSPYKELPPEHAKARAFPDGWGLTIDDSVDARRAGGPVRPDPSKPALAYDPQNIPKP